MVFMVDALRLSTLPMLKQLYPSFNVLHGTRSIDNSIRHPPYFSHVEHNEL